MDLSRLIEATINGLPRLGTNCRAKGIRRGSSVAHKDYVRDAAVVTRRGRSEYRSSPAGGGIVSASCADGRRCCVYERDMLNAGGKLPASVRCFPSSVD